ncbi:MAG: hypothetical protein HN352_04175 [Bacteroidetes bacterium]|jgi:hypothetical protein|nr:hypothetical protein [Bacteroidota bacterium]MBT3748546.1 hypothetical protein [Bacteroidota bacterium]MBT4398981.1 hypothetical protein [Bacteroidota bacterium]MBT4411255.1 hypothetical protein [Bacteroidota bacterium]MBT7094904.1 hypothetical protein [Bacteroidota bacterium]
MNPVFFSINFFFWVTLLAPCSAQVAGSVLSTGWQEIHLSKHLMQERDILSIRFDQPLAVSNLLYTGLEAETTFMSSRLKASYSLLAEPGMQVHGIRLSVGKWLSSWIFVQTGLVTQITATPKRNPVALLWSSSNTLLIRLTSQQYIRTNIDHLSSLFSRSPSKPPLFIHSQYQFNFERDKWFGLGFVAMSGHKLRMYSCLFWTLNKSHALFAGLILNPAGMSLGYAFTNENFSVRIIVETSSLFGLAPSSTFSWIR